MDEYISKDEAMDAGTLCNWYISSIDETVPPVWTEEHIEELLRDFLVIPKETPPIDVAPVVHGHWEYDSETFNICSACKRRLDDMRGYKYCPVCGAKMDGKDNE